VLPANIRLDWKVIAKYKHSSLFGLIISNKGKSFITLTPGHRNFARRFFASLHGLQIQRSEGVSRATKEKLFHEFLFHGQNKI
jgi:hypothetical protein